MVSTTTSKLRLKAQTIWKLNSLWVRDGSTWELKARNVGCLQKLSLLWSDAFVTYFSGRIKMKVQIHL